MGTRDSRIPAEQIEAVRAVVVAESMRKDFLDLIAIVESEIASGSKSIAGIAEARAAAERGLRLSEELVEVLRSASEGTFEQAESARGFR